MSPFRFEREIEPEQFDNMDHLLESFRKAAISDANSGNNFIGYLNQDDQNSYSTYLSSVKRQKVTENSSTTSDEKEAKILEAKNRRDACRSRLRKKRQHKEMSKKEEESTTQDSVVEANKKKDTIWKIIMDKDRRLATIEEETIVSRIEELIERKPDV